MQDDAFAAEKPQLDRHAAADLAWEESLLEALACFKGGTGNRVLKIKEVEQRTGKKKSSIYAAMRAGSFPAAISLGSRARGWLEADIEAWITARTKATTPQPLPVPHSRSSTTGDDHGLHGNGAAA